MNDAERKWSLLAAIPSATELTHGDVGCKLSLFTDTLLPPYIANMCGVVAGM